MLMLIVLISAALLQGKEGVARNITLAVEEAGKTTLTPPPTTVSSTTTTSSSSHSETTSATSISQLSSTVTSSTSIFPPNKPSNSSLPTTTTSATTTTEPPSITTALKSTNTTLATNSTTSTDISKEHTPKKTAPIQNDPMTNKSTGYFESESNGTNAVSSAITKPSIEPKLTSNPINNTNGAEFLYAGVGPADTPRRSRVVIYIFIVGVVCIVLNVTIVWYRRHRCTYKVAQSSAAGSGQNP